MKRRDFLKKTGTVTSLLVSNVAWGSQFDSISSSEKNSSVINEYSDRYTVACYYFPNYHVDPKTAKVHGPGWSEWDLMKMATPRFDGHHQPKIPNWGYEDESDPEVMAKKINAAADHGVDAFIFDWYYHNDGPFLQSCLEEGFLQAPNNDRLKFAIMWANHDWVNIHPTRLSKRMPLIHPGNVTLETFVDFSDYVIKNYFKHPSYWKIDGAPYFSAFLFPKMIDSFGGVQGTKAAINQFRKKTKEAGFSDLHLNCIVPHKITLPGQDKPSDENQVLNQIGADSATSYHWLASAGGLPHFPTTEYKLVQDNYIKFLKNADTRYDVPYFANGMMGWDSTPRCLQSDKFYKDLGYPWIPVMINNTPDAFHDALTKIKEINSTRKKASKIITINAWNEWTEGSHLEPGKRHGMAYLEAVRDVFG